MKARLTIPFSLLALLVMLSIACGAGAPATQPAAPSATANLQATIDAALAATASAQAGLQSTVDAAIAATAAAAPPIATPVPATVDEYVTMSEEELQALIDQAAAEAVTASQQASAASAEAAADDTITTEEVQTVQVVVDGADEAIAYAEELISVYYSLYGELASESLDELQQIEQDLESIAESLLVIENSLAQVQTYIAAGAAVTAEVLSQLEGAAEQISGAAAQLPPQLQNWDQVAQMDRDGRANAVGGLQPNQVPADLQASIAAAFSFIDGVRGALGDQKLSRDELNQIAQLGANASAGLNAHGGPKMQGFSGKINEITNQLARGQIEGAKRGLGEFEMGLGQRPAGLPRP
jgi:hypothetical protein